MQIEDSVTPPFHDFRPIYKPISIEGESILDNIGSIPVLFKNYVITLDSESSEIFHTFIMDSHELKEGKLEGSIPCKIAQNGACTYEENVLLVLGKISEKAERYKDLFLLTISEDPEESGKLIIESKIWYEGEESNEGFQEISGIYKYQNELYVLGVFGGTQNLWKLNLGKFIILISK